MRSLLLAAAMVPALLTGCSMEWKALDDPDGDGYTIFQGDCDEGDPAVHPNAEETWYDGVDANCDGADDFDADGDGFTSAEHGGDDCHDDVPDAFPGSAVADVWYDCVDQDCDGNDGDQDGDGFVAAVGLLEGAEVAYMDTCPEWERVNPGLLGGDCWDDAGLDYAAGFEGEGAPPTPAEVFPDEAREGNEAFYDGVDQNCDGWDDFDADGDGYAIDDECDDTDPLTYPNPQVDDPWYDCQDQNCDGNDGDQDGDGYLAADYTETCPDWATLNPGKLEGDCFDDEAARGTDFSSINNFDTLLAEEVHPGATETWYDGVDQDCAGDDDFDADGDRVATEDWPDRSGARGTDCEDDDPRAYPGGSEYCDTDYDDDCDDQVNERGASGCTNYNYDGDRDGFGDPDVTERCTCAPGDDAGWDVLDDTDCDDGNASIYPGATEITADGVDQDCSGGDTCYTDADRDGFGDSDSGTALRVSTDLDCSDAGESSVNTDCDDADVTIYPGAAEGVADGVDQNCDDDELCYTDSDGDSYGSSTTRTRTNSLDCDAPSSGFADDDDDCNDSSAAINPGATELPADGVDQNCDDDELCYTDNDGDSYGSTTTRTRTNSLNCNAASQGFANDNQDCDDNATTGRQTFPGAASNDSASACMTDDDQDDWGDVTPSGNATAGTDCDDGDAAINPGATEICDNIDNDCDSDIDDDDANVDASTGNTFYRDADSDNFGNASVSLDACDQPSGYVLDSTDCDDTRAAVYPGANELCSTAYDDDCDSVINESSATDASTWYRDADSDGFGVSTTTQAACTQPSGYVSVGTDCDDTNDTTGRRTFPGAAPNDSVSACMKDQDQDDWGDDNAARANVVDGTDCNDSSAAIMPGAIELVNDGVDQDCDDGELCYVDADGDGYGSTSTAVRAGSLACDAAAAGFANDDDDCDDGEAGANPGELELCSTAYDDDCDGDVNEDDADDVSIWYADADSDSYGDADIYEYACTQPTGYVSDDQDCLDGNADVNPGGDEALDCFDGLDNDCDGFTEDGCFTSNGGELLITEIFYAVTGNAAWFEVSNESGGDLDLYGMELALYDTSTSQVVDSFVVDSSLPVLDGERVVFCKVVSNSQLGAACDFAYDTLATNFNITNTDNLAIRVLDFDGVQVDEVAYQNTSTPLGWPDASTDPDLSIELCTGGFTAADNDDGANWSNVSTSGNSYRFYNPMGTDNDRHGTPGAVNSCE